MYSLESVYYSALSKISFVYANKKTWCSTESTFQEAVVDENEQTSSFFLRISQHEEFDESLKIMSHSSMNMIF